MSAFVIDPKTMDKCVRAICGTGPHGQVIRRFADVDTAGPTALTTIGRRLYAMNVDAVRQRYPGSADDLPGSVGLIPAAQLPARYTYSPGNVVLDFDGAISCLKALHCLRYQCSEGNVDESPLYAELSAAIGTFADHLVQSLPAYQSAPWGD